MGIVKGRLVMEASIQVIQEHAARLERTNARLRQEIEEHRQAVAAIQRAHDDLEKRVQDRTVALSVINELLQLEVEQRKQSEQVAHESEARHRALIDAIPDAMITVQRDGMVLKYKASSGQALPAPAHPGPRRRITDLLPLDFAGHVMAHVAQALETGNLQVFDYRLPVGKEGQDIEVRVAVSGGDETLCILRDITERKRAERLKTEFLSVVSHELRTPLTSISGSLALLSAGMGGELPDQAHTMIDIAHRNSERLVRLINDLLDLQKIESGTMPMQMEPVEVIPLIERVLEATYAYGSRYGITFELHNEAPDVRIYADADRLMQVLTNLLSNAAKFSPAGSSVTLTVARRERDVRVCVADRGVGIPNEYQQHIFKKFAQIDSSSSRQKEGTGLGLSISKAIVEMHGGCIGCESEPGAGATFFFDVPEWCDDEEPAPPQGRRPAVSRSITHDGLGARPALDPHEPTMHKV